LRPSFIYFCFGESEFFINLNQYIHQHGTDKTALMITIQNVARISPTMIVPKLFGTLVKTLNIETLKVFTAYDIAVFKTPEDQLYENGLQFMLIITILMTIINNNNVGQCLRRRKMPSQERRTHKKT
jgi:hypothetical protein